MAAEGPDSRRTALVTGSSNGIGEAIVKRLAALDFRLVVTGRLRADIERVAGDCQRLSPSGERPLELQADLELEADVGRLFEESLGHFRGRLDLLVNNAGLSVRQGAESAAASEYANFRRTLQVNLCAAVRLTLLAREPLERTARLCCGGRPTSVIQISSIVASRPLEDYSYCVSKCALSMFANCMSGQLGPLVRVNTISPGPIETKIIERGGHSMDSFKALAARSVPLGRIGQADEVAEAVVFLADQERASYISGAQLSVDGAMSWAQIRLDQ